MATANEEFFDALVRHQIGLLRFSGKVRNDILALLDATEADMRAEITRRLSGVSGLDTPRSVRRLQGLERALRNIRLRAWSQVTEEWVAQMNELAQSEPLFVDSALKTVSPVVVDTNLPTTQQLRAMVRTRPFQGRTMRQWAASVARADLERIDNQIKIGLVQGESNRQIARRVVGTVRRRGTDGVTQITRNQAAAITRTATNAISNQARTLYYQENEELFTKELYTATLDDRTTTICASLDGQRFDIGDGPQPPLHFQCRSIRVAILDRDAIGSRPARNFTRQQLVREYTGQNRLKRVTTRDALPRGHKGRFDEFARRRKRELTGTTPARVSYQDWLGRQSKQFQDDVLGPTRSLLFRRGKLKLSKFVNRRGDEIPLRQLAINDRQAFLDAGLNPDDFL